MKPNGSNGRFRPNKTGLESVKDQQTKQQTSEKSFAFARCEWTLTVKVTATKPKWTCTFIFAVIVLLNSLNSLSSPSFSRKHSLKWGITPLHAPYSVVTYTLSSVVTPPPHPLLLLPYTLIIVLLHYPNARALCEETWVSASMCCNIQNLRLQRTDFLSFYGLAKSN